MPRSLLLPLVLLLPAAAAAQPACLPCPAVAVADPAAAVARFQEPPDSGGTVLVKWRADLAAEPGTVPRFTDSGATPWIEAIFRTPTPLLANAAALATELDRLAKLAAAAGDGVHVQLAWGGAGGAGAEPAELAYLIKRASVAVAGAATDARVFAGPLPADELFLRELYAEELAAYLDGVAFAAAEPAALERLAATLAELDPGAVAAADAVPWPGEPAAVLAEAARLAERGVPIALVEAPAPLADGDLEPFRLMAAELAGDLSLDSYSVPSGGVEAWSFVRGDDLSLRVVARSAPGADSVTLTFPDPTLRSPALLDLSTGEPLELWGFDRSAEAFSVEIADPPPVLMLRLERMTAAELEGVLGLEERLTVADTRQIPVEEILRRLQAFEDAQARRLETYTAVNTTHLRFQAGTGAQSVETTFRGPFFFRQGEGFDWAWQEFYVNGVRWRRKTIPEIPLIQPEKAATLPVEITFTKEYRYEARGTDTVDGRDCWVVDFRPAVAVEPGRSLYQGTVWIDREVYARVRTRAVQLGLEGEVLSNEETVYFSPVDARGLPADWTPASYVLPLRLVGQQLWSVLNAALQVEREIVLEEVAINPPDFADRLEATLASEATMVRETDRGLRYLVPDEETGERVVQEGFDLDKRFLVAGVFHDESQEFPIPLAGMNWLWFDWRGKGIQANVFFAGALLSVGATDPTFLGSRWDAGVDVFALALAGTDTLFRGDREIETEDVEVLSPSIDFKLGRPLGSFVKLEAEYEIEWKNYSRADETAAEFVIPSDNFEHGLSLTGRYQRNGYRLRLGGTHTVRSSWEPWGLPGNADFSPDHDAYTRWGAGVGKTWHLPNFLKLGLELEYVDGSDLDRFSKYEFGQFSDLRVRGYQSDKVRAEEALAAHLTYGFDVASIVRLDLVADLAWATDRASLLDNELLAGVGIAGTFVGPWSTVVNVDVGVAVDGPDDGISAFVAILKLFGR